MVLIHTWSLIIYAPVVAFWRFAICDTLQLAATVPSLLTVTSKGLPLVPLRLSSKTTVSSRYLQHASHLYSPDVCGPSQYVQVAGKASVTRRSCKVPLEMSFSS